MKESAEGATLQGSDVLFTIQKFLPIYKSAFARKSNEPTLTLSWRRYDNDVEVCFNFYLSALPLERIKQCCSIFALYLLEFSTASLSFDMLGGIRTLDELLKRERVFKTPKQLITLLHLIGQFPQVSSIYIFELAKSPWFSDLKNVEFAMGLFSNASQMNSDELRFTVELLYLLTQPNEKATINSLQLRELHPLCEPFRQALTKKALLHLQDNKELALTFQELTPHVLMLAQGKIEKDWLRTLTGEGLLRLNMLAFDSGLTIGELKFILPYIISHYSLLANSQVVKPTSSTIKKSSILYTTLRVKGMNEEAAVKYSNSIIGFSLYLRSNLLATWNKFRIDNFIEYWLISKLIEDRGLHGGADAFVMIHNSQRITREQKTAYIFQTKGLNYPFGWYEEIESNST